jgi:hypothetical protein
MRIHLEMSKSAGRVPKMLDLGQMLINGEEPSED